MATDIAEEEVDASDSDELASPETETQTGFNLSSKKLRLVLLLLLVMGVQVAVGYMLLPKPAAPDPNDREDLDPEGDLVDDNTKVEVPLGTFNTTNTQPGGGGAVTHFKCKLTAIAARENSQSIRDASSDTHKDRIRAAVNRVIRSSSLEELNDPDCSVMKRKIRAEINKVMPKAFIIEVIMSDIRVIPQ